MDHEEATQRSFDARRTAWSTWGAVEPDVLGHLVNPMFLGGPQWPNTRQAYTVARRGHQTLVASDGLSDPSDDGPDEGAPPLDGLEHEFFAVTPEPLPEVAGSWLFEMAWQISNNAAAWGGIGAWLDELGLLSVQLYDVNVPEPASSRYVLDDGTVGVLLGLAEPAPPARVAGPLSAIRLVNVKLLTKPELQLAIDGGDEGRRELARRFAAQGGSLLSGLDRPSVA